MPLRTNIQPAPGYPLAGPRRRAVLYTALSAGLAGALLGGCSDDEQKRRASLEDELRRRAHRDTAALIAAYTATAEAHPELSAKLRPLRADLDRHALAFAPHHAPGDPSASPSPPPSASAASAPPAPKVPGEAAAAARALADAERRTAKARTADLRDAPPELARLLASVAASGAGHALLLGAIR